MRLEATKQAVRPRAARYERPAMEVVRMDARVMMTDVADNSADSPYKSSSSSLLEDGVG